MALSSTCHIFRSHCRNARDARTDLEVFIYTYAAEAKLGAMDEAGIAVHRRDRKGNTSSPCSSKPKAASRSLTFRS
jgi:hypothetical protein